MSPRRRLPYLTKEDDSYRERWYGAEAVTRVLRRGREASVVSDKRWTNRCRRVETT